MHHVLYFLIGVTQSVQQVFLFLMIHYHLLGGTQSGEQVIFSFDDSVIIELEGPSPENRSFLVLMIDLFLTVFILTIVSCTCTLLSVFSKMPDQ